MRVHMTSAHDVSASGGATRIHPSSVSAAEKLLAAYARGNNLSPKAASELKDSIAAVTESARRKASRYSIQRSIDLDAIKTDVMGFLRREGIKPVRSTTARPMVSQLVDKGPVQPLQTKPTLTPSVAPVLPSTRTVSPPKLGGKPLNMLNGHALPRRVKSLAETVELKSIQCLEDGKRVKDLAAHLQTLGMTPSQYRRKWGLDNAYPMHAPQMILQRGLSFEVDYKTGERRQVRI